MANYDANIVISANISRATSEINKVQAHLSKLNNFKLEPFANLSQQLRAATAEASKFQALTVAHIQALGKVLVLERQITRELGLQASARNLIEGGQRTARSARAGVLGSPTQLRGRLQEFRENRNSAQIARERNAELQAQEARLRGSSYGLNQVPAGGQLFPGGNTATGSSQYRAMLNEQARIRQAAASALAQSERTVLGLQAQTLLTERQITTAKVQQTSVDERSISIARERNKLLLEEYRAEQRVASGTLDRASRVADLRRRKALGEERGKQAESLALGVGFPLLFGGGVGSVAGAAAGSFVGSGFGGQILGGAIGQIADQFAQAAAKMGSALRDPVQNFKEIADAGLLASKSQERYIQKLIDAGRVAEASALIQGEIIKKIGVQGMKDLQGAGAASDRLNKSMAELGLQMQAAVAGPLADLLNWVNGLVSAANNSSRVQVQQRDFLAEISKDPTRRNEYFRRSQALMQANGGVVDNAALQRLQREMLPGGIPKQLPKAGSTTESQQLRATTAEMQAQVNLASKQLGLAGLTLEKDGARYVQAAKAVALQEYDNRLLEIKNSWIGKIFDREQNLAQIRAANLEYSAKLRGIDAQVAQKATADNNSLLQQEQALLKVRSDALNTIVQYKTAVLGEETGLKTRLELNKTIEDVRRAELQVEQELAMREAAKNGTLETTQRVYAARKALLEMILDIEEQTTEQKHEQLRIDNAINENRKTAAFAQQMQDVFSQVPTRRSAVEQLQFNQATRRGNLLNPKFQQLDELQQQLASKTLDKSSDRAIQLQKDLARVNDEIGKLTTALNYLDSQETVWMRQRGGVDAMHDSVNGVGAAIRDGLGQALLMAVGQTENLAQAMQNLAADVAAAVGQMLILNAIKSGLSALGGNDGVGFFSILSGNFGKKAASGAYWPGGFQAFADGGMVTRPTMGLVGEGGESEYIIPASKMRSAMNRYASGARGSAVIPAGSDSGDGMTATMTAPGSIDVRYTVERINSVDYVTADQFQAGMRQAAAQGAAQGEQRTLRRLQTSTGTRKRIGI